MTQAVVDGVKDKLLSSKQVRDQLKVTEPLQQIQFAMRGSDVAKFKLEDGWNVGADQLTAEDSVSATVKLGSDTYVLSREGLLEATSLIGLTKQYVLKSPAKLIEPQLSYWYSNRDAELKALVRNDRVLAFTKSSIVPFSNLELLDVAEEVIEKYGHSHLFDWKFHHDLRGTAIRLVISDSFQNVRPKDTWSIGVQLINSLTGEKPTEINGYLFRWVCTNGMISTHASSGKWNRRTGGQSPEDLMEWARQSVDEILGGLEHELDAVKELAGTEIPFHREDGSPDVGTALTDVFEEYRVPVEAREAVIAEMVDSDDLTMYGVMNAITAAANGDVRENIRRTLMEIGGDLPRANTVRCQECHRITHN